jgi:heme export protein D (CcmD)
MAIDMYVWGAVVATILALGIESVLLSIRGRDIARRARQLTQPGVGR